jgi:hypothetical protein
MMRRISGPEEVTRGQTKKAQLEALQILIHIKYDWNEVEMGGEHGTHVI